jgi:hypothetical protein
MPFVKIKGATANFSKPGNWDEKTDGPCGQLWVRRDLYGRYNQFNFAWRPTPEELAQLIAGASVEVHIINHYMPPIGVSVVTETDE